MHVLTNTKWIIIISLKQVWHKTYTENCWLQTQSYTMLYFTESEPEGDIFMSGYATKDLLCKCKLLVDTRWSITQYYTVINNFSFYAYISQFIHMVLHCYFSFHFMHKSQWTNMIMHCYCHFFYFMHESQFITNKVSWNVKKQKCKTLLEFATMWNHSDDIVSLDSMCKQQSTSLLLLARFQDFEMVTLHIYSDKLAVWNSEFIRI